MDWTWGLVVAVGFAAGAAGASLYTHRGIVRRLAVLRRVHVWRHLAALLGRPKGQVPGRGRPARPSMSEDSLVLIPDGRLWPLGAALQLLELAWRWQVVHGANLPLRARQGEGAYVWRPPLPARTSSDQQGAEAER